MTSSIATQPAATSASALTAITQSAPPASVARQAGCMTEAHGAQSAALILAVPAQEEEVSRIVGACQRCMQPVQVSVKLATGACVR